MTNVAPPAAAPALISESYRAMQQRLHERFELATFNRMHNGFGVAVEARRSWLRGRCAREDEVPAALAVVTPALHP